MADPIEAKHRQRMNDLAAFLDEYFNGPPPPVPMVRERTTGFFLAVFDFNTNGEQGRFNYISNSDRLNVAVLLREMTARFEGQPELGGTA
jgi:hypothetical protein